MRIEEDVPLSGLTTFKVGGPVRFVLTALTDDDIPRAVDFATQRRLPLITLGSGSNVLAPDEGLEATVLKLAPRERGVQNSTDTVMLDVDAGMLWDDVVQWAVAEGWWGIENLSAIPGTVGGALVQNIGAYGAVLSDTVVSVRVFDVVERRVRELSTAECLFAYRTSIFKQSADRFIITRTVLQLSLAPRPNIKYKDLKAHLDNAEPVLSDIRQAVIDIRAHKFPPLDQFGTAGSFFLNPVMAHDEALRIQAQYPSMPLFIMPEGGTKVPLGWFFEHILKLRGHRDLNTEAWREQALVLVAHEGATATEILKKFAQKIIERAQRELRIELTPEVRML